ncbi:glycosyl hydrolase [Massilia sp. CT11-137]|uniref:glycosyl hydrolase n=1 Tax=Massilia sp. CT11-137 TaxID=3393901 RepID=UPI0039B0E552
MTRGLPFALMLALAGSASAASPRATPVDAQADARTRAEYTWLVQTWGRQTIAGQQDLTWNDGVDMARRVFDDTGRYPALMGFDFMNTWQEGDGSHQVDEAIAWARRGGLVTFCWHWRDPSARAGTQGNFYAREPDARKNTAFTIPVRDGRLDTSSPAGRQIDADIDRVAVELGKLQAAGVTVLWRPLHEASGSNGDGWFWWGRRRADGVSNAEAYKLLYRHMFDRLVREHGLHNLIWVWNGQDAGWYPGDDVVDIAGYDVYDERDRKTYRSQIDTYRRMAAIGPATKPVAMTENSYIPDPDNMRRDGARWLWFLTWNDGRAPAGTSDKDNFWTGDYYNNAAHKTKVYRHPDVITLDELPAFLKAPQ